MILFGSKCPNLGIWAHIFQNSMSNLNSAPLKKGAGEILLRLESKYFLAENAQIWAFGLQI